VAAEYRGAFGPEEMWLSGWTWYDEQGFTGGVAPSDSVVITGFGLVDADTLAIDFVSIYANTAHAVMSSPDLAASPFTGAVTWSGGSLTTDGSGVGHVEIDLTGDTLFFQIQVP
jgi:hypothetical protein